MAERTYHLLLVTKDPHLIHVVNNLSDKSDPQKNIFTTQVADNFSNLNGIDLILISRDIVDLFMKFSDQIIEKNIPIIFLSNTIGDLPNELEDKIQDIIDINKASSTGFSRAIKNVIDKFVLLIELNNQKTLLTSLSQSLLSDQTHLSNKASNAQNKLSTLEITDLLNANKQLIGHIQSQNSKLKNLAETDVLTKTANRLFFDKTLEREISRAKRYNHVLGLLFLDLDKFKNVNDTHGHQSGDLLLQLVVKRLQETLRKNDFLARIGGDEFAIILTEIKSTHAAGVVAWKIIQELEKPYDLNGKIVSIGVSVGVACYPMIADSAEELMKNADIAMYLAKQSEHQKYAYATASLNKDHLKRMQMENEIRNAIKSNAFTMYYQPIISLLDKKLRGFEALIRWHNKTMGIISPSEFIPIAEDSRLIHPISDWILNSVCKQIAEWKKHIDFPYVISINLSPIQLSDKKLLPKINELMKKYQIPFNTLEFELTEMAVLKETEKHSQTMKQLAQLGATQALDDFGTGYSSISHLKYLPISTIKIDRSFVTGLGTEKTDYDIVSSIIALARKMNLHVVAEGVETEMQLKILEKEKCEYAQGFYFSKPIPSDNVLNYIKELIS